MTDRNWSASTGEEERYHASINEVNHTVIRWPGSAETELTRKAVLRNDWREGIYSVVTYL